MRRASFLLLVVASSGCTSPKRSIEAAFSSAARFPLSGLDARIRQAVCGWDPKEEMVVESIDTVTQGSTEKGSAETTTKFVAKAGSQAKGLACDGRIAFRYEYHEGRAGKHGAYFSFEEMRRLGDPPRILTTLREHAAKLAVDAPMTTFGEEWRLPDGTQGAAFRVEIATLGKYVVKYDRKFGLHEGPRVAVFQEQAVAEGNDTGERGYWKLQPGTAWFLLAANTPGTVEVRVSLRE